MGINVEGEFVRMAESFLYYIVGFIAFKYLGIPMAENLMKVGTSEPLIELNVKWLGSYRSKFVSLGGRVVLSNYVLNSISILVFHEVPC